MRGSILEEAREIVTGDRAASYGDAREDMERIAQLWSVILGCHVEPWKVPACMIALKLSRLCHRRKRDSIRDIAGYADILALVECEVEAAPVMGALEIVLAPSKCICVAAPPDQCDFIRTGRNGLCDCGCHNHYAEGGHAAWQAHKGIRVKPEVGP
jgi:hypothetical protein